MSKRLHTAIVEFDAGTLTYQYMCQERDRVPPLALFRKEIRLTEVEDLARRLVRSVEASRDASELGEAGGQYRRDGFQHRRSRRSVVARDRAARGVAMPAAAEALGH